MIYPVKWNKFYPHNKVVKSFIQGTNERNRSWWKNETKRYIKQKKGNFFKIVLSDHIDRGVWFTCWTGLSVHCPHGLFDREPLGATLVSSLSPFAHCSLASSPISIIARLLEPLQFSCLSESSMFYSSNLVHLEDSLFAICFMQPPGPSLSTTTSALKAERIPSVWNTLVSQARTFSVRQQRFQAALISGSQRLDCLAWITVIELTSCIILYRNRMSMQLGSLLCQMGRTAMVMNDSIRKTK